MTNQIAGVWRLRSAERTAHGHTADWFGADPDGLLIFTEDLHFTEAITRTDLPAVASGDRLSTTRRKIARSPAAPWAPTGPTRPAATGPWPASTSLARPSRTGTTPGEGRATSG